VLRGKRNKKLSARKALLPPEQKQIRLISCFHHLETAERVINTDIEIIYSVCQPERWQLSVVEVSRREQERRTTFFVRWLSVADLRYTQNILTLIPNQFCSLINFQHPIICIAQKMFNVGFMFSKHDGNVLCALIA